MRTLFSLLFPIPALFLALAAAQAKPGDPFPPGRPADPQVSYEFAIYYVDKPAKPPLPTLKQRLAESKAAPALTDTLPRQVTGAVVQARLDTDVKKDYAPPSLSALDHFGRGLTHDQAVALQSATTALILRFAHPQARSLTAYRSSLQLAEQLARDTGGLLWDEETREVFTTDEWHKRRLLTWEGDLPAVGSHVTIHAYNSGKLTRAISLGMRKFGLPDVVVKDFTWSLNRSMGHLINLLLQSLVEGANIPAQGRYVVDMNSLRHAAVKKAQATDLLEGSTGRANLTLVEGRPEEGDPDNRLIEIRFDAHAGNDKYAKQESLLHALYGSSDSISYVDHTQALKAASEAARTKLPALRDAFAQKRLAPGEYILLKAPFDTPDGGREWMWVEVTEWTGDRIVGMLKNDPFNIPTLHGGQLVTISQAKVFDYIRQYADGKTEGNETSKLIAQQQKAKTGR